MAQLKKRIGLPLLALALVVASCGADSSIEATGTTATSEVGGSGGSMEMTEGPGLVPEATPLISQLTAAPDQMSDADLVTILEQAELTKSWGCGLGFTLSSEDQHVALFLHPKSEIASESPVTFPDETWNASILIGNDLLANNCDDVIEPDEPEAYSVANWPLSAGTLTFAPPDDPTCVGESVVGTVDEAVVETPNGELSLGSLSITNEAFGCFAG